MSPESLPAVGPRRVPGSSAPRTPVAPAGPAPCCRRPTGRGHLGNLGRHRPAVRLRGLSRPPHRPSTRRRRRHDGEGQGAPEASFAEGISGLGEPQPDALEAQAPRPAAKARSGEGHGVQCVWPMSTPAPGGCGRPEEPPDPTVVGISKAVKPPPKGEGGAPAPGGGDVISPGGGGRREAPGGVGGGRRTAADPW